MCSCGLKGKSFTQIIQEDKSSLPTLKYLHCKHKEQFESLFSQIGINATEANLPLLASLTDNGGDRRGDLKAENGQPIIFSVETTLLKIDRSQVSNNNCAI